MQQSCKSLCDCSPVADATYESARYVLTLVVQQLLQKKGWTETKRQHLLALIYNLLHVRAALLARAQDTSCTSSCNAEPQSATCHPKASERDTN